MDVCRPTTSLQMIQIRTLMHMLQFLITAVVCKGATGVASAQPRKFDTS